MLHTILNTRFSAALVVAGLLGLATMLTAQDARAAEERNRRISVTGVGEVTAAPDMATVTLGVVSEAETAAAALAQNSETVSELIAALKAEEIADRDIQTANFSIQPKIVYPERTRTDPGEPRIVGYTVNNSLIVRIRNLERTGAILDRMVTLGSNTVSGIQFGAADPKPIEARAREAAVADAKARAELYAKAAGVALGDIVLITESGGVEPPRPVPMARTTMAEAMPVPVEGGELSFSARVSIVWDIAE
jgi:uncharacterized protein YggE